MLQIQNPPQHNHYQFLVTLAIIVGVFGIWASIVIDKTKKDLASISEDIRKHNIVSRKAGNTSNIAGSSNAPIGTTSAN